MKKHYFLMIPFFCWMIAAGFTACTSSSQDKMVSLESSSVQSVESLSRDSEVSEDSEDGAIQFCREFINAFHGAVANQEAVSFEDYISNENLLAFADKMLTLTQKQVLNKQTMVIYGENNQYKPAETEKLSDKLTYIKLSFSYQGSGVTCQLLVESDNDALEIVDFYFGTPDGIDTLATGHPADRTVRDPDLWNQEKWVSEVMERVAAYEASENLD